MAAPGAVTFLLVLATVVPALLVDGCASGCPEGYQACAGQCWRLLDHDATNFWSAAPLCQSESLRETGVDSNYIAIPSPRNSAEDVCAYQFAAGSAVWFGFIRFATENRVGWLDYKHMHWMTYSPWAPGQPSWVGDHYDPWHWREDHMVLIPVQGLHGQNAGWHDVEEWKPWRTLCVTRYCR